MTTPTEWVTSIVSTMKVTGVKRQYAEAPGSLSTADLPASFPEGVEIVQEPLTFQAHGGRVNLLLEFVIAVEGFGQGNIPQNFGLMMSLATNLDLKLRSVSAGQGKVNWVIQAGSRAGPIVVAGNYYWGVRATIEGKAFGPQ